MVYGAARACKGINLRGREAYATVPNSSSTICSSVIKGKVHPKMTNSYLIVFRVLS